MKKNNAMSELDFKALELKVNQLIEVCKLLDAKNKALTKENQTFKREKAQAIQQKEMARTKVESMITSLKAMELNNG